MNAIQDVLDWFKCRLDEDGDYAHGLIPPMMLSSAAAELQAKEAVILAAQAFVNNLPECEIDLAREVWGNTNTLLVKESRAALAAALKKAGKG